MGGILDPKPRQKVDFIDIVQADSEMKARSMENMKKIQAKESPTEQKVQQLQDALSGKTSEVAKVEKELQDMDKYSDEDLTLAEELLFNGFAKKNIKLNEKTSATFYTTNANEISVVNEMMFEFTKKYELGDGRLDLSQKTIDSMNQLYLLGISFKGYNDKELSEAKGRSLDLIKSALKKLTDLEIDGDMEKHKKLLDEIKNAIRSRTAEVKKLSGTVLDVLSMKRFEFERLMYSIITRGDILPKS